MADLERRMSAHELAEWMVFLKIQSEAMGQPDPELGAPLEGDALLRRLEMAAK